jgi:hypothetical protein
MVMVLHSMRNRLNLPIARIAKNYSFLQAVSEGQINGTEGRTITLKIRGTELIDSAF